MAVILGIDVGGSTTKIVGIENGKLKSPLFITATDPVTSLFGAFGKYLYDNQFNLEDIEQIILTGVGSAYINTPLYGRPTAKTDEFIANALGAKYQSGLDRLIAVSMGTGTSFIQIEGDAIKHLGGTGIAGTLPPDAEIARHPPGSGTGQGRRHRKHQSPDKGHLQPATP